MAKTNIDQCLEDIINYNRKKRTTSRYTVKNRGRRYYRPNRYLRQGYSERYRAYRAGLEKARRGSSNISNGIRLLTNPNITKMNVSNLEFGVTQGDMRELFGSVGKLKHVALHYDKNGRSQGTCEIIFERKVDALKAFHQYNGVPLDGRSMILELMGEPMNNQHSEPPLIRQMSRYNNSHFDDRDDSMAERSYDRRDSYGNNDQSFGRRESQNNGGNNQQRNYGGRGRNQNKEDMSAENLDKELDAYLIKGLGDK